MKTKIWALMMLLSGFGAWVWTACDKIPENETRTELPFSLPDWHGKYVVLEDFTGVRCVNCPAAALVARSIKSLMQDSVILIELHPEKPASLTRPHSGDPDLRSAAAQSYSDYWQVPGLPRGMINRRQAPGQLLTEGTWLGTAVSVFGEEPVCTVSVTASLADSTVTAQIQGEFTQDYAEAGDIHVITMLLEDGFVVKQSINGGEDPAFNRNHVLRATFGSEWGAKVLDAKPSSGKEFTLSPSLKLDAAWKSDELSVVVLVTNADTREILNAAQVHLN